MKHNLPEIAPTPATAAPEHCRPPEPQAPPPNAAHPTPCTTKPATRYQPGGMPLALGLPRIEPEQPTLARRRPPEPDPPPSPKPAAAPKTPPPPTRRGTAGALARHPIRRDCGVIQAESPPRCPRCSSTDALVVATTKRQPRADTHPTYGPYTEIVWRRKRCRGCGQIWSARSYENHPKPPPEATDPEVAAEHAPAQTSTRSKTKTKPAAKRKAPRSKKKTPR